MEKKEENGRQKIGRGKMEKGTKTFMGKGRGEEGETAKGTNTFTGKGSGEEKKESNIHIEPDPVSIVFGILKPTLKFRKTQELLSYSVITAKTHILIYDSRTVL